MILSEAIQQIRDEARGVETLDVSDREIVGYINRACFLVNNQLSTKGHPSTIKEVTVKTGDDYNVALPNFVSFAGKHNVSFANNTIVAEEGGSLVRYFAAPIKLKVLVDNAKELPVPEVFQDLVIQYARSLLLNRQDMDITQDAAISQSIITSIADITTANEV